jgi:hypothetical protein
MKNKPGFGCSAAFPLCPKSLLDKTLVSVYHKDRYHSTLQTKFVHILKKGIKETDRGKGWIFFDTGNSEWQSVSHVSRSIEEKLKDMLCRKRN